MKQDWFKSGFTTLVTFGQSTTAGGWSSCRQRCWAEQLRSQINAFQRRPVHLVNAGIGANVISPRSRVYPHSSKPSASERLDRHVLGITANGHPVTPDLLVISYGICDACGGTPVDAFAGELTRIIERVRERIRPLIVLLGPYHMTDYQRGGPHWSHADAGVLERYNARIRRVAGETDCLFVDLLASFRGADWLVHDDGCHVNDLGHRVIANAVFEVLASNCSGLAAQTRELEKHIAPWRDESTLQG